MWTSMSVFTNGTNGKTKQMTIQINSRTLLSSDSSESKDNSDFCQLEKTLYACKPL